MIVGYRFILVLLLSVLMMAASAQDIDFIDEDDQDNFIDFIDENDQDIGLIDEDDSCSFWASIGECTKNPNYMLFHCKKSCYSISPSLFASSKVNQREEAQQQCLASDEQCQLNNKKVPKGANEFGKPPEVSADVCDDRSEQCVEMAQRGECDRSPGWMIVNCPSSCNACHLRDAKVRCSREALNISTVPAYAPGDMNDMFSSIERDFGDRYDITVMSTDPWVVVFDNFVSEEEINAMISTVEGNWERSTDTGQANEFGEVGRVLSTGRTSSNAWCRENCMTHPNVEHLTSKIQEITRIPSDHYESYQILQYDVGQYYRTHHDMDPGQVRLSCGPRILTFFLYLSDVEEGGETAFPNLGLTVKPKRGRALLWPSTMNDNPEVQDARTYHAASTVLKGKKYAANAWIHLYDFSQSNLWGCTGAFDYI